MREMSVSELVTSYGRSLEQQIVGRGSNLACGDEALWKQAEDMLRDGDAQETHRLGLDPLRVMEESLAAASAAGGGGGRVKARGGLSGLAKAFEVLEQAALNLYLGPWRDEYKVVKMYSGMFTHYIKPVLSMPQVENLFGLLGYQSGSSRHEQLRLRSVSSAPDDLLCLSCAFFLARCECRLLLAALGKHVGDTKWELSVVRERQRGNSLQVALDNTKKTLNQPLMAPFDGEEDLYTDEHVHGGQREAVVNDNASPCSLTWVSRSNASPAAANGAASSSAREHVCVSTLNCQLTKTPPLESDATRSSSAGARQGRRPREESRFDHADSPSRSLRAETAGLRKSETEADRRCSCLQSPHVCLKLCTDCNVSHDITCPSLQQCYTKNHRMMFPNTAPGDTTEPRPRPLSPRGGSPTLSGSSVAMSSLALCDDDPKSMMPDLHPIAYHECCDLARLDPQALCLSCGVFHSGSCRDIDFCQNHHDIKPLGVCSCGRACSRTPLVLCRYCGNEFCNDCWYRNPVVCTCGQTFDQSSSV